MILSKDFDVSELSFCNSTDVITCAKPLFIYAMHHSSIIALVLFYFIKVNRIIMILIIFDSDFYL